MELHELDVGDRHAGPQRHGQSVAGGLGRIGGDGEDLSGTTGGQHGVGGPHLDRPTVEGHRHHAPAPATLHQEVEREPFLEDRGGGRTGGVDQGPLHLGPGGRTPCVDDARSRVAALARQGQRTARLTVEDGPHGDQLVNPRGSLVDQHTHGIGIAQPGAGGQGVGEVEVGGVLVATQDRGHTALGPAGGGLGQLGLGQYPDPESATVTFAAGRTQRRSEAHRSGQARHPTAQDEDVECPGGRCG